MPVSIPEDKTSVSIVYMPLLPSSAQVTEFCTLIDVHFGFFLQIPDGRESLKN